MYLYFDRTGVLKEIVNDEALRQGNYGINKIYVYIDKREYDSIDVSYVNSEGTIIGPQNHDTFTNPDADTPADNCYIPYDQERDLKFFKYWTPYKFLIIDLEATTTESNNTEVALGPGPLDVPGIVHCSLSANLETSDILQLGDVNFKVQPAPGLNNQVAPEHYLSLSNYLFLKSELDKTQKKLYRHEVWLRNDDSTTTFEINIINSSEDELNWVQVWNYIASGLCTYNHTDGLDLTDDEFTIRELSAVRIGTPPFPKIYLCSIGITNQDDLMREVVELEAIDNQSAVELE